MGFKWDDEEFRDMPEEVNGDQPESVPLINAAAMSAKQPLPTKGPIVQPELDEDDQEFLDSVLNDEEEDYEAVLADANLRIEQGTLYKLIMNHNIFEGREEDQRAIYNVQREIRKFAKERMEIMLGMRQEAQKQTVVSSPFNEVEVMVLKKMASTFSKGATEKPEVVKGAEALKQSTRKEGLNPIGGGPKTTKSAPAKKTVQALTGKPQAPLARQTKPAAPAPSDDDYKPLEKPLSEMTPTEIIERNKQAAERQAARKPAKSTSAIPQPTPDQEEMWHTQRVMTSDNPLASSAAVSAIVSALNKSKAQ